MVVSLLHLNIWKLLGISKVKNTEIIIFLCKRNVNINKETYLYILLFGILLVNLDFENCY